MCFFATALAAQPRPDSLMARWQNTALPDTVRITALQDLAWSMMYSQPDSTARLAEMEKSFAVEMGSKKWEGKALNVLAGTYHVKGEYATALYYYQQSLAALQEAGELKSVGALYNNIGLIFREQGHNLRAVEYYGKYLEIGEKLRDTSILASAFNNLGTVYSDQGDYPAALNFYKKGLECAIKSNDSSAIAIGYNNIGTVYFVQANYDAAIEQFLESQKLRERLGDRRGVAVVINNIGRLYKEQKRYTEAKAAFMHALEIQKYLGDRPGLASTYFSLGSTYNDAGKFAEALRWCEQAWTESEAIDALRPLRNSCNCLYKAYKGLGNNEKALYWHERFVVFEDSLQKEETSRRLEQLIFSKQILTDSLQREEEKLKMEVAHRDALRNKDRLTGILIVSGLVVLALALGFWSRMLHFRKYSEEIEHKAQSLEKQQLLSEIALLKTQVNPHFLFNSLSILASLVHKNPDLSEQFIQQLSRSYRYILEQKEQPLVTVRTELEFIDSYAFLLKIRFENKFGLQIRLPETILDHAKIAPLTLQLLVENAVKHNRMSAQEPLMVEVEAVNDFLIVRNRLRPRPQRADSTGTGLNNIINRYLLLTDRPVWAGECEEDFVVKIPLL